MNAHLSSGYYRECLKKNVGDEVKSIKKEKLARSDYDRYALFTYQLLSGGWTKRVPC